MSAWAGQAPPPTHLAEKVRTLVKNETVLTAVLSLQIKLDLTEISVPSARCRGLLDLFLEHSY